MEFFMPKKHGHTTKKTQSPTYVSYQNMISRCHRENHPKYPSYGEKGITVCERWRESFENFLSDMGERPDGMTIDRIDGRLGYSKENCRWATSETQQANIRTNVNITFQGRTQNISAWASELGLDASNLAWRLRNGWPVEQALTTTPHTGNRTRKTRQVLIEYKGKTQCISHWAKEYGLSNALLRLRLSKGWTMEDALTTPKGVWVTKGSHQVNP
jgi:hypothetical protein